MDERVKVPSAALQELVARLTDRRIAVERELITLGETKKGSQDIFKHCRGFERSFQVMLNEANVAFKIRAVVEGNLPDTLRKIPIEKRFNKDYTREICRVADGCQPHLVSPERGIKRLVVEAMRLTNDHVHRFVDEIHLVLMETVREAARRSVMSDVAGGAAMTDARTSKELDFLRLKGFEDAVIRAASEALEEWRKEAHRVAEAMVQMECDYVTPSFFRELERRWQEEAVAALGPDGAPASAGYGSGDNQLDALAAGEVSVDADGDDSDAESSGETGPSPSGRGTPTATATATSPPGARAMQQRADMKAGWLEKRAGDSSSLSSLPVDSWRWQKRWFVLAMEAGVLYYFPTPEDPGVKQPKVIINMRECVVEDFQPDIAGMPTRKSTQRLENNAGSVSLLIKISHRNPNMALVKNHHHIILRAADAADKYEWLARLRNATEAGAGVGKGPKVAGSSQQYLAPAASSGPISPRGTAGRQGSSSDRGMFGRTLNKVTDQFARFTGLGGSKLGDMMGPGSIEDLDAYYEKLGTFCGIYARMVYDRMAKTIPKAIILCQVIRSRDRLLDQLFNYISSLSTKEVEFMLQEDPTAARRRTAAEQASKDLIDAQEEVKKVQEMRAAVDPGAGRKDSEEVSVRALLLAGAFPLVPKDRVPPGIEPGALYGEHTPLSLTAAEAKKSLGAAVGAKKEAASASSSSAAASGENGMSTGAAAAAAAAAAKPRRQPPPPPPKHA